MTTPIAGSRLISVPNAAVVKRRNANSSRQNGTSGTRIARTSPVSSTSAVRWPTRAGGREAADEAGDRHGDRESPEPRHLVADPLGEQNVRRPAHGRGEGERDAERVQPGVPRLGQQHHADPGGDRPQFVPAVTPRHRDAERPEKLQRARRAQRQPGDRVHEQDGQGGGHEAEHHAGAEAGPAEVSGERSRPGPAATRRRRRGADRRRRADPRREQAGRAGQPELDEEHGGDGHGGAGPGGGLCPGGCCFGGQDGGHAPK